MSAKKTQQQSIPVLPLRDVVVFPYMVMPLFVGRPKSIRSLDEAMETGKQLLLVSQKQADLEEPTVDDVYRVGTVANIIQLLKLPDGTVKVLVEGQQRATIEQLDDNGEYFSAQIRLIETEFGDDKELEVVKKATLAEFEKYAKLNKKVQPDVHAALERIEEFDRLSDTLAAHMPVAVKHKQKVLEIAKVVARFEYLLGLMESETDLLQIEKRIRGRVKEQMEKTQRDYYLNEQIKAIQKELGEGDSADEIEQLRQKIEEAKMPAEAKSKAEAELQKLKMMSPMSAEATVVRSYIDWMIQVPWHKRTKVKKDLTKAQQVLDADHYGLERVKERILEYLAVQTRLNQIKGPILCLVGPPGVGKTSLGQSIAQATGR
ncbi:TPA: LON peptidase substrate-binding domain-containing protein, partial [Pasteurella multocida]|nr:LON peptidase substrate-binding domain-containing protein [Pasteurella multocida]